MDKVKVDCRNCGSVVEKSQSEFQRRTQSGFTNFFCNLSCSVSFQQKEMGKKNLEEYNKSPNRCKFCDKILPYLGSPKFCDTSCSAKYNNPLRRKEATKNHCLNCDCEVGRQRSFCSNKCQGEKTTKSLYQLIESGEYQVKSSHNTLKKYLIHKRGHKCEMCGLAEWGYLPILLILDHINGDSNNSNVDNLRLVCSNCDTLNPTYKGRNRGNGRSIRRERYRKGVKTLL
jgi:YHS domain-containing protein